MTTLYIQEQGASLRRSGKRLIVHKGSEAVQTIRLRDLERVVIAGSVELTAPAIALLLDSGIETLFISIGGRFRGRLAPAGDKNIFLRRAQFRGCEDTDLRVRTARFIVDAKIASARSVLWRHARNHPSAELSDAMEYLARCRGKLERQAGVDTLLGVEGDAARVYFKAFGTMVRSEFTFTTRTRRPPRDPVNALLSFGYALLTTELTTAAAAQGLDPMVGLLHELDYGRPSLALDLEEEFRHPVVDRLALSLVNRRVIRTEHFESREDGGVLLNEAGRTIYLECYHKALETEFADTGSEKPVTYRDLFRRQAHRIRGVFETGADYVAYRLPGEAAALRRPGNLETGRQGDKGTGRQGDFATTGSGDGETVGPGDGLLGTETVGPGDRETRRGADAASDDAILGTPTGKTGEGEREGQGDFETREQGDLGTEVCEGETGRGVEGAPNADTGATDPDEEADGEAGYEEDDLASELVADTSDEQGEEAGGGE